MRGLRLCPFSPPREKARMRGLRLCPFSPPREKVRMRGHRHKERTVLYFG